MRLIPFVLMASTLICPPCLANQYSIEIPKKIVRTLNTKYPGWHLVNNLAIMPVLQENGIDTAKCRPNFVWGDFDGNGEKDYVVFVERNVKSHAREQFLVLFLGKGLEFEEYLLDEASGDASITQFIWLAEKGTKCYNFDNDEEFILETDAIELVVWEKASDLIFYDKGEFRRITTGD
jgi:hypothetical protein